MQQYEDLFMPSFLKEHNSEAPSVFPKDISLSMAYIPFQQTIDQYTPENALSNGTLFKDLNMPFEAVKGANNE